MNDGQIFGLAMLVAVGGSVAVGLLWVWKDARARRRQARLDAVSRLVQRGAELDRREQKVEDGLSAWHARRERRMMRGIVEPTERATRPETPRARRSSAISVTGAPGLEPVGASSDWTVSIPPVDDHYRQPDDLDHERYRGYRQPDDLDHERYRGGGGLSGGAGASGGWEPPADPTPTPSPVDDTPSPTCDSPSTFDGGGDVGGCGSVDSGSFGGSD